MEGSASGVCDTSWVSRMDLSDNANSLHGLMQSLPVKQVQALQALLARAKLRCDIVGKTPLELVQKVFQHLQLYQAFQARRVSKHWSEVLSAHQTTGLLMRSWFPKAEASLTIPAGLSTEETDSLKAEHIEAYRNTTPFSRANRVWTTPLLRVESNCVSCAAGSIARICSPREVRVVNVASGVSASLQTRHEDSLTHLTISSFIVAGTTASSICYAWNLDSKERYSQRIHSTQVQELVTSHEIIAVLHRRVDDSRQEIFVTTWSLNTMETYYFPIRLHQPSFPARTSRTSGESSMDWRIMINIAAGNVIFFERWNGNPVMIFFTSVSFGGVVEATGSLRMLNTTPFDHITDLTPVMSVNGRAIVWSYDKWHFEDGRETDTRTPVMTVLRVIYDIAFGRLRLDEHIIRLDDCANFYPNSNIFFDKDVAYYHKAVWRGRSPPLCLVDMENLQGRRTVMVKEVGEEFPSGTLLCGDEKYMVAIADVDNCVWCFDKNISLADEDQGFKMCATKAKRSRSSQS